MLVQFNTYDTKSKMIFTECFPLVGITYNTEMKATVIILEGSHPRFCPIDIPGHKNMTASVIGSLKSDVQVLALERLWVTTQSGCQDEGYVQERAKV